MLARARVIAITDRHQMVPAGILASGDVAAIGAAYGRTIERAVSGCAAGSVIVQVREKDLDGALLLELVSVARQYSFVLVNDRIDVALAAGARGVHLPEHGIPVADARRVFRGVIGVSRHAPDRDSGADLVQLGPIWPTPSKPGAEPLGTAALGISHGTAKLVAVGGIATTERARIAVQAGADAVAVIRAAWSGDSLVPYVTAVEAGLALR